MAIIILRILYAVWVVGGIFFNLHAASCLAFREELWKKKVTFFFLTWVFSFVWPLAVFSPEGRKILWYKIEHF